eukprot:jgi/Tetstr1/434717/TSEL_023771.t1
MSKTVSTVAEELANVQALLERRSKPVKFDAPHMPGYLGHVPGGSCVGLTKATATINSLAATGTLKSTGSLKGTLPLMYEKRPVGEQDFYAEECDLVKYDFGRHQGDYFQ